MAEPDGSGWTMERLEGTALIVHAIDLVIADVEQRIDPESEETVQFLQRLRQRLLSETD